MLRKMAWECAKANCKVTAVHVAGAINILADAVSRLREGRKKQLEQLLAFHHHGRCQQIEWANHMSHAALSFLSCRCGLRR